MNINQVDNIFSFILLELVSCILACLENSVKICNDFAKKEKKIIGLFLLSRFSSDFLLFVSIPLSLGKP